MNRDYYNKTKLSYDYKKQVWIKDGKYQNCGHKTEMNCGCYGRIHKDEIAVITEHCQ